VRWPRWLGGSRDGRPVDPADDAPGDRRRAVAAGSAGEGPPLEPEGPAEPAPPVAPEPFVFSRRDRGEGIGAGLRIPILAVVVGLVALAVVVQDRRDDPARAVATEAPTPIVAPAGVLSTAWYCAAGGPDQTLVITNAGTAPAQVVVTVMASLEIAVPATRPVDVPAASTVRLAVRDVAAVNEPGVLVEALAGEVSVAHEIGVAASDGQPGDAAVAPCASEPGPSWYFAAGSTERGATDHVVLFNPFADDATVDLTILTPNGPEKPGAVQAVPVPHQSRVTVALEEVSLRQPVVGVAVTARRGRIVAEQVQQHDGSEGRVGVALVPGVARPTERATFPDAFWSPGGSETLVVANPADVTAIATVSLAVTTGDAPVPSELRVPPGTVVTLNLSEIVAVDVHHAVVVDAAGAATVVAALVVTTTPRPVPPEETTTTPPATAPPPETTTSGPTATVAATTAVGETTTTAVAATTGAAPAPESTASAPAPETTATTAVGAPAETTTAAPGTETTAVGEATTTAAAATTTVPETTTTTLPPTTLPATTTTFSPVLPPLPNGFEILVPAPPAAAVWLVPGGPPAAGTRQLVGIANGGLDVVTVTVNLLDGGRRLVAPGLEAVTVEPGQSAVLVIDADAADAGTAALVEADAAVAVSRWTAGATTVTAATGIPFGP
jgi:hypothetical protein